MNWYSAYKRKFAQSNENQGIFDFNEEEKKEEADPVEQPKKEKHIEILGHNEYGQIEFDIDGAVYTFQSAKHDFIEKIYAKFPRSQWDALRIAEEECKRAWVVEKDGTYRDIK